MATCCRSPRLSRNSCGSTPCTIRWASATRLSSCSLLRTFNWPNRSKNSARFSTALSLNYAEAKIMLTFSGKSQFFGGAHDCDMRIIIAA